MLFLKELSFNTYWVHAMVLKRPKGLSLPILQNVKTAMNFLNVKWWDGTAKSLKSNEALLSTVFERFSTWKMGNKTFQLNDISWLKT